MEELFSGCRWAEREKPSSEGAFRDSDVKIERTRAQSESDNKLYRKDLSVSQTSCLVSANHLISAVIRTSQQMATEAR